jgi:hypothetical protein
MKLLPAWKDRTTKGSVAQTVAETIRKDFLGVGSGENLPRASPFPMGKKKGEKVFGFPVSPVHMFGFPLGYFFVY